MGAAAGRTAAAEGSIAGLSGYLNQKRKQMEHLVHAIISYGIIDQPANTIRTVYLRGEFIQF